jgi:hypothetical protein
LKVVKWQAMERDGCGILPINTVDVAAVCCLAKADYTGNRGERERERRDRVLGNGFRTVGNQFRTAPVFRYFGEQAAPVPH